uniref:Uncharacterized protein n=1 Tax=Helianthus annuus TaxID=4232 RepID=A0A251SKF9_HELAN
MKYLTELFSSKLIWSSMWFRIKCVSSVLGFKPTQINGWLLSSLDNAFLTGGPYFIWINLSLNMMLLKPLELNKWTVFIQKVIPIYSSYDKQLVSRDRKRNKCNYKYTFSLEI